MTLKLFEMVDRLQTFGSITNVLDRFSKRQGGRTKDTLKAGPAPTPPPHRSIIEYIFYYHYMYIRNVSISEMSSGRVKMVGSSGRPSHDFLVNPILTVIKMYMSGRVKMFGHRDGRVG